MAKTLFLAVRSGCPMEFDEIEDPHVLETLKNAYARHGYTVLTAGESEEDSCARKLIEARLNQEKHFFVKETNRQEQPTASGA